MVRFDYNGSDFFEVLGRVGSSPLPPYIKREAEEIDKEYYQTVYAKKIGAVAAPTAGLHFTDKVMKSLSEKDIQTDYVSLDVGAGTFKPVKATRMAEHQMHTEKVYISLETVEHLLAAVDSRKIIAVGTTTTRTIESLYWFAMKIKTNPSADFKIHQWDPYQFQEKELLSPIEALKFIKNHMVVNNIAILTGQTQLIIAPGYQFKFINLLITNFHQPKSTLLLLVAAFYGEGWRQAYQYALSHQFRFLSYGDSCLFVPKSES